MFDVLTFYDSGEQTGNKVGEGGQDRERSLSQDSNLGRCKTTALHVSALAH